MLLLASALLTASLGNLPLQSGKTIVWQGERGEIKRDSFPTWFNGTSADLEKYIGPKGLADDSKYFIIAVDAVTKKLGIQKLYAVMGISMGGRQTFQWLAAYPDLTDRAVTIVATPKMGQKDILL